ncbi:MAG: hypothetical protein JXN61_07140, partial [Sedimentisphaerales bacterium]|nr:hypothetical protein [Sedimentisphaerales bacterium]
MRPRKLLHPLILLLSSALSLAQQWYAAPNGSSTNPGNEKEPWDIASGLDGRQKLSAGDTLYLLGGTYKRRPEALFEVR